MSVEREEFRSVSEQTGLELFSSTTLWAVDDVDGLLGVETALRDDDDHSLVRTSVYDGVESRLWRPVVFKAGLRKAIAFARGTLCGCYEIDIMFHTGICTRQLAEPRPFYWPFYRLPSNRLFSSLCPSNRHREYVSKYFSLETRNPLDWFWFSRVTGMSLWSMSLNLFRIQGFEFRSFRERKRKLFPTCKCLWSYLTRVINGTSCTDILSNWFRASFFLPVFLSCRGLFFIEYVYMRHVEGYELVPYDWIPRTNSLIGF